MKAESESILFRQDLALKGVKKGAASVILALAGLQCIISPTTLNFLCVVIIVVAVIAGYHFLLRKEVVGNFPLTGTMILFFSLASLTVPLIAKTLEWEPVIYKLQVPLETFGYSACIFAALLCSHLIYRNSSFLQRFRQTISLRILKPLRAFEPMQSDQIWILGILGLVTSIFLVATGAGADGEGTTASKILAPLGAFAYAPFLIPFRFLLSPEKVDLSRKESVRLLAYFGVLSLVAIADNSRGGIAFVVSSLGCFWLFGFFAGRLPASYRSRKLGILLVLFTIFLTPLVSTLFLGMEIARNYRGKVSATELLAKSVEASFDSQAVQAYLVERSGDGEGWTELYSHNVIMSRFIMTKFHDNELALQKNLVPSDRAKFWNFEIYRFVSIIPGPILEKLGITVDKASLMPSDADYLNYLSTGADPEGYKTTSGLASNQLLFGDIFRSSLMVILATLPLFAVVDALTLRLRSTGIDGEGQPSSRRVQVYFSPIPLLSAWSILYVNLLTSSSFSILSYLLRGFPQIVIFYFIVFNVSKSILKIRRG